MRTGPVAGSPSTKGPTGPGGQTSSLKDCQALEACELVPGARSVGTRDPPAGLSLSPLSSHVPAPCRALRVSGSLGTSAI